MLDRRGEDALIPVAPWAQLRKQLNSLMEHTAYYGAFLDFLARQFGCKLHVFRTAELVKVSVKSDGGFKGIFKLEIS